MPRDRTLILEDMAVALNIQAELAAHIHHKLEPTKQNVLKSHLPIMGIEALMKKIESDETIRKDVIRYLSEPLSRNSIKILSEHILTDQYLVRSMTNLDFVEVKNGRVHLGKLGSDRLNQTLTELHDNYTTLPIEIKSGILSVLLVPGEHRLDEARKRLTYDDAIQMVFKKVFKPGMENFEEAESFASAYLETAQDFERPAILAALMALSANNGTDHHSVPERAAQIMRLLGPAYVKFGQTVNSHPRTHEEWKDATAELKSNARIEPRWETIRRTIELLPPEQASSIVHFGPVLGSASFNTAMELTINSSDGEINVVSLTERPHAWTRADTGFGHLGRAIDRWDHPSTAQSKRTVAEMIIEAKNVARVETDPTAGAKQYSRAQEMYAGTEIQFKEDGTCLTITPASSYAAANQIRLISKAEGVHFSELPETTLAERTLKQKIAKAYIALELSTILAGRGFDCDRHGRQMKVDISDPSNIKINLYDFGGVDIKKPSKEANRALGRALNDVALGLQQGRDPISLFESSLDKDGNPEVRMYLMRARKAWLALQDFQKYVEPKDMLGVLHVAIAQPVDPDIMTEFKSAQLLKMFRSGGLAFEIRKSRAQASQGIKFIKVSGDMRDQFSFFSKKEDKAGDAKIPDFLKRLPSGRNSGLHHRTPEHT